MDKKNSRLRRARKARGQIATLKKARLTVHRSNRHLYAQVIDADGKVVATASTLQASVKDGLDYTKNIEAAAKVGKTIGEKAKAAGIESIAFDRSGFRYHGRIKALADAAREAGLEF